MAKTIITLGREYCTGGRYIAEDVANALGIKLYDKELITMAAKNSGLSEEAVAASEKRHTHSLLYSLYTMGNELPLGDQVFILQSRIIKQLAEEGPCVILGRCGDYVLRERKDVLRVFVYAPKEWRLQYAKTNPLVKAKDEKGIKDEVEKTDRNRSAYYNYYTQNRWGDAHNYDLAINAALGRETCVKMLLDAAAAINNDRTWAGRFCALPMFPARRNRENKSIADRTRRGAGKHHGHHGDQPPFAETQHPDDDLHAGAGAV